MPLLSERVMTRLREYLFTLLACDSDFISKSREELLHNLLLHAGRTVPYYRQLFNAIGLLKDGQIVMPNFDVLPVLERQVLRESQAELISSIASSRKTYWNTSGGSTGEPCVFLQDAHYLRRTRYMTFLQKQQWGYTFGDPLLKVWGDEREVLRGRYLKRMLTEIIKNEVLINAFSFSEAKKMQLVKRCNSMHPLFIVGYVQILFEFAQFLKAYAHSIRPPRVVMVSAGVCYPEMRSVMEQSFQAPIVNRYGSREVGVIACEEPGTTGLIVAPTCLLEVDTGSGIYRSGSGEILVTSLINEVMPLFRYRIGDSGELTHGKNGVQILTKLHGRSVDLFRTFDGTLIDGEFFTHLLYQVPGITKFRVVQKTIEHIEFLIQREDTTVALDEDRIRNAVQTVMGSACTVQYSFIDVLPEHPSGKHRYTISEVQ